MIQQLNLQQPTEEQLMESLSEATKCRNLTENADFQWLVTRLQERIEKERRKLASDDVPAEFHKRQGKIYAVELFLKEVRFKASLVEELEERLEKHDRGPQPVARGA